MKQPTFVLLIIIFVMSSMVQSDFLKQQQQYDRVRTAIAEKQQILSKRFQNHGIELNDFHMLLIAYKESDMLEIYAKRKVENSYRKICTYFICSRSGNLGPKRRKGDKQVPEGFYHIDRFNPSSKYYLSLGINYPNLSDQRKSNADDLGGDIFIHGKCVTIGCLPMTDLYIKEIYILAVYAKNNGQKNIPVYIFPYQMSNLNHQKYKLKYEDNVALLSFWDNLKIGYDQFMKEKKSLEISISQKGDYLYN